MTYPFFQWTSNIISRLSIIIYPDLTTMQFTLCDRVHVYYRIYCVGEWTFIMMESSVCMHQSNTFNFITKLNITRFSNNKWKMFIRRIDSSYSLSVQNTTQFAQHEKLSINGPHAIQKHESMRKKKNEVFKEYFFIFTKWK